MMMDDGSEGEEPPLPPSPVAHESLRTFPLRRWDRMCPVTQMHFAAGTVAA
jgi:hypothetical protein